MITKTTMDNVETMSEDFKLTYLVSVDSYDMQQQKPSPIPEILFYFIFPETVKDDMECIFKLL